MSAAASAAALSSRSGPYPLRRQTTVYETVWAQARQEEQLTEQPTHGSAGRSARMTGPPWLTAGGGGGGGGGVQCCSMRTAARSSER
eukprot:COSAG02_NODE_104_length_36421_cov_132.465420_16_plen_87_part_00